MDNEDDPHDPILLMPIVFTKWHSVHFNLAMDIHYISLGDIHWICVTSDSRSKIVCTQSPDILKLQNTISDLHQTHEICQANAPFVTDTRSYKGFACVYLSHASLHNLQACFRLQEALLRYCKGEKSTKSLLLDDRKKQAWQTRLWGGKL